MNAALRGRTHGGSARVPRAGSGVAPEPLVEPFSLGNGFRRDAENGNRDGRAPQPSPSRAANGSLGWTNAGADESKFVLTLALTFYPLPRGEEMTVGRFRFCGRLSGQSSRGFFKKTAPAFSLSAPNGSGEGRGEVRPSV